MEALMTSSVGEVRRREQERVLRTEQLAVQMTESLSDEIRRLSVRHQGATSRAQAHRRRGQLVPSSLLEELAENALRLRRSLDRYAKLTDKAMGS
jgi:hypothetical protein